MAEIFTATGAKISIGPVPADTVISAALFAALTPYTEIGLVESLGEFGDSSAAVTFASLSDARMRKAKGVRDAGTMAITCGYDAGDAGQLAVLAAEATTLNYAFKIELPNKKTLAGTNEFLYFKGLVMTRPINVGSNDNVVRRTFSVAINSPIYNVVPT